MKAFKSVVAVGFLAAIAQAGGVLMVPESSNDQVMTFDAFDGSLINMNFIDLTSQTGGARTPINAVPVGNEIWVTDQLNDNISRWSGAGAFLGHIGGAMDNIRGLHVNGNTAYVANSGSNNGAPGEGVVTIDIGSQSISGSFTVGDDNSGDPFDIIDFGNGLLINDIDGEDLELHDLAGAYLSNFHDSDGLTGIDFPQQMARGLTGSVLASGFSLPAGIYEYDGNGNQINYYDVGTGLRGIYQLGNGNIMFTDGAGVHIYDIGNDSVSDVVTGVSARYIELIPEPASLSLLALGALVGLRRR